MTRAGRPEEDGERDVYRNRALAAEGASQLERGFLVCASGTFVVASLMQEQS
jgi:hypothetical protein